MNVFDKILNFEYKNNIGLVNMTDEFFALYLKKLFEKENNDILIVTPSIYEANKLNNIMSNYTDSLCFVADDLLLSNVLDLSNESKTDRLSILNNLLNNGKKIVFTDVNGYLMKVPSVDNYKKKIISLKKDDVINVADFLLNLVENGYTRESVVTKTGEFAARGFVIDIYLINYDYPVRVELFGDQIESIRFFDPTSQKSINEVDEISLYPFVEAKDNCNILAYMHNSIVFYKDYAQIVSNYNKLCDEYNSSFSETEKPFVDFYDVKPSRCGYYFDLDNDTCNLNISDVVDYSARSVECFNENMNKINDYLGNKLKNNKTIVICLNNTDIKKFVSFLTVDYVLTDENNIFSNKVNVIKNSISYGFEVDNYIFLSEYELFNRKKASNKRVSNFKYSTRIKDLSKIVVGDYVVHNSYGIGIYNGIKTLTKNGCLIDYLEVLYDKGDKLYIPASKIELISKFSGKDGYVPKINALNSSSWVKSKQRVREKIKYEAERLLKVQAERSLKKGFAFSKEQELQVMFDNEFKYEETLDQLKVWEQIKHDMESDSPMDRILCGDVGYGKTEIAFRAMFKAVLDKKQVMYLCPTTLLSKQQYESALERFKNYPVNIAILNRFVSPKETKDILNSFSLGKIDILFGTHRILSNDVKPYDLGLLVVDEEQRFGVAHKEKIKEYKSNIDVLTLTATPIPRTLQMAMLGLKNLSLIETPPKNRHAVQTYVTAFDKRIIKDVIYKELYRNGQVFILYNKVEDIDIFASNIAKLVPDARVVFAHGQMHKTELEDKMNSFINGDYDVLVCTTIIETGVDIPNANSLIIIDADKFGLSQLYQIRGRVGRSDRVAYAYLMYSPHKLLNDIAIKRLKVIKEFTELGSGFTIASRDLSIRGAGDILGSEQAGFIDTVGIDLYMKMLNDEMLKLKGLKVEEDDANEKDLIEVSNHINDKITSDEDLKIEIHRMINSIDSTEKMHVVEKEIKDRFGIVDDSMILYMNQQLFEKLAKNKGVSKIVDNNMYVEINFTKEVSDNIKYEDLFVMSINICKFFNFSYKNGSIYIKIFKNKVKEHPIIYFNQLLEKM